MGYQVMISYSSVDKPTADAVCARLEDQGIRCWIAPRDILPGMEWGEAILEAIKNCEILVMIFSSSSNDSKQVLREVERAVHSNRIVIPFRIEDLEPTRSMQYFLSVPHWLDAFTPPLEEHIRHLGETIKALLRSQEDAVTGKTSVPEVPLDLPSSTVVDGPSSLDPEDAPLAEPQIMVSIKTPNEGTKTTVLDSSHGRTFILGRGDDCQFQILNQTVSMRHATLIFEKSGYWSISDLNSSNGTWLNGQRVGREGSALRAGDKITIGMEDIWVHRCISKR